MLDGTAHFLQTERELISIQLHEVPSGYAPADRFTMDKTQLQTYLAAQVEEIQKYKWIESERRCHDIGFTAAAFEWINRYSAQFRDHWTNSRAFTEAPANNSSHSGK